MAQLQDFQISICYVEYEKEVKVIDACESIRVNDTTERSAKIKATKTANAMGLIAKPKTWDKPHSPNVNSKRFYNEEGVLHSLIVQRVSRITR